MAKQKPKPKTKTNAKSKNTIILQMKHSKRTCDNKARSQQKDFQRATCITVYD